MGRRGSVNYSLGQDLAGLKEQMILLNSTNSPDSNSDREIARAYDLSPEARLERRIDRGNQLLTSSTIPTRQVHQDDPTGAKDCGAQTMIPTGQIRQVRVGEVGCVLKKRGGYDGLSFWDNIAVDFVDETNIFHSNLSGNTTGANKLQA